jgi:PST family polysaccharide transporter
MKDLFLVQLIGDVLKIASWIVGNMMLAKAMTKVYVFSEIVFSLLLVGLALALVPKYGVLGFCLAHMIHYLIHLIFNIYIFRRYFFV